jgi:hypothetical protein
MLFYINLRHFESVFGLLLYGLHRLDTFLVPDHDSASSHSLVYQVAVRPLPPKSWIRRSTIALDTEGELKNLMLGTPIVAHHFQKEVRGE